MSVFGLEHIGLLARDTESLATWYRDRFDGTEVSRSDDPVPVIFLAFGGGALLELVPAGDGDPGEVAAQRTHVCWGVGDLPSAVAEMEAQGVPLDRPVFTAYDGSAVAFFRDPEGNLVQLVERVAGSGIHSSAFGAKAT